jgi:hypothetical protein
MLVQHKVAVMGSHPARAAAFPDSWASMCQRSKATLSSIAQLVQLASHCAAALDWFIVSAERLLYIAVQQTGAALMTVLACLTAWTIRDAVEKPCTCTSACLQSPNEAASH